ncbi:MAG: hydroxymethylpyrimidine/phosphomethylpyrimidine kinase [Bradymonadaceae bacterium]
MTAPGCLLTIAGTDPSGGAGIQVDLQVFRDYDFHGVSVITAVVWQNTVGVRGFEPVSSIHVLDQIDAVVDDLPVAGVKVGMLADPAIAEVVGDFLCGGRLEAPIVFDPVLTSGRGTSSLHRTGMMETLRESVVPDVDWLTPNVPEAEALLEVDIDGRVAMSAAARELAEFVGGDVLLKGGHLGAGDGETIRDVWARPDGVEWLAPLERIEDDVRGTGCQLSSALAAELAGGAVGRVAAESARVYLNELLHHRAESIGTGRRLVVRGRDAAQPHDGKDAVAPNASDGEEADPPQSRDTEGP